MVTRPDITPEKVAAALAVVGGSTAKAAALLGCNDSTVRRHHRLIRAAAEQEAREARERARTAERDAERRRAAEETDDWRALGACVDEDPELFFPLGDKTPESIRQEAEAKAVCRRCDCIAICLRWSLDNDIRHGVWGGTSERERRQLSRSRKVKVSVA